MLERWTGVPEPNLSPWRRRTCGDLTAAFDFSRPDYSLPDLPELEPVFCAEPSTPAVPAHQLEPVQEPGSKPVRP